MEATPKKSRTGCLKVFLWGCLGIVALFVIAVILFVANFNKIVPEEFREGVSNYIDSRKASLEHMGELNSKLDEVITSGEYYTSINFGPGENHDHLVVNIRNANLDDDSDEGMKEAARKIALFAARNYTDMESIDTVVVVFISQVGAGVTLTRTTPFPFPVNELLPDQHLSDGTSARATPSESPSNPLGN